MRKIKRDRIVRKVASELLVRIRSGRYEDPEGLDEDAVKLLGERLSWRTVPEQLDLIRLAPESAVNEISEFACGLREIAQESTVVSALMILRAAGVDTNDPSRSRTISR